MLLLSDSGRQLYLNPSSAVNDAGDPIISHQFDSITNRWNAISFYGQSIPNTSISSAIPSRDFLPTSCAIGANEQIGNLCPKTAFSMTINVDGITHRIGCGDGNFTGNMSVPINELIHCSVDHKENIAVMQKHTIDSMSYGRHTNFMYIPDQNSVVFFYTGTDTNKPWGSDGMELTPRGYGEIATYNLTQRTWTRQWQDILLGRFHRGTRCVLSSDAHHIMFIAGDFELNRDIYVMDIEGADAFQLRRSGVSVPQSMKGNVTHCILAGITNNKSLVGLYVRYLMRKGELKGINVPQDIVHVTENYFTVQKVHLVNTMNEDTKHWIIDEWAILSECHLAKDIIESWYSPWCAIDSSISEADSSSMYSMTDSSSD